MSMSSTEKITRRQAVQATGKALAGVASLNALSSLSSAAELSNAAEAPPSQTTPADTNSIEKLRIATCQFPVSASPAENAKYIRDFMHQAAGEGAHLLHTSEASLSGYAGCDFPTFENYDWDALRKETADFGRWPKSLKMWLVLGSSHFLDENTKPTDCLYLIDPEGKIVDRYDKCFCTGRRPEILLGRQPPGDARNPGSEGRPGHLLRHLLAAALHRLPETGRDGDDPFLLATRGAKARTAWTRSTFARCRRAAPTIACGPCANNSSQPYSHWGSFVARPDATIAEAIADQSAGHAGSRLSRHALPRRVVSQFQADEYGR